MGKVRTEVVKKISRELIEKHPDRFTMDFEFNKKSVNELVESETKRLRNRIAGYTTSLKRVEMKRQASAVPEAEEVIEEE